jgi:uncharacterized protein
MTIQSYDYAHRQSIEPISWERFAELSALLAEQVAQKQVEMIIGIARAGLFPATAVACCLRCEFYPVRITRREQDQVVFQQPVWKTPVPAGVSGKRVAVIDEMADTGETLRLVAEQVRVLGAVEVVTASLVSHSWAKPAPDIVGLVTDALVLFPWDRRVYLDGQWQFHPELVEALRLQGLSPQEVIGDTSPPDTDVG